MTIIFRRPRLGRTSCREISNFMNTPTRVVRNDRRMPVIPPHDHDFDEKNYVFRWGTTSNIEGIANLVVVNTAEAIHRVNDKTGFRKLLNQEDLCPDTCFDEHEALEFIQAYGAIVVRPAHHAQGRHLYVCRTGEELNRAILRCGHGWYASKLVDKVAEYRVFVAQGRVVWVAKKTPGNPDDVAWNVARGGRFDNVRFGEWPLRAVKTAVLAFNLSGLDFGGVDVMVDGEGNAYVLEINSAPSQTSPYRQECVAKAFDWIVEHGKAPIPLIEERGGYRKFIHPAVSGEAILRLAEAA